MTTNALHDKYRPQTLAEVVGQDAICRSLAGVIANQSSHTFLFVGPSGTGKTTLARIVAGEMGCTPADIEEVDAATNTGIDDMRAVTSKLTYVPWGGSVAKALIIDEVHRLSGQAWDSLLKSTEEPPNWAYWFFCTTNLTKVPKTIITRCTKYELKDVPWQSILNDILMPIAGQEGINASADILGLCAREAHGSPRQALQNLTICEHATDKTEAAELLRSAEVAGEAVELARALIKGAGWEELIRIMGSLTETNPESIRQVVRAYCTSVVMGAKTPKQAQRALAVMDSFSQVFNSSDGISPVLLAMGRLILL